MKAIELMNAWATLLFPNPFARFLAFSPNIKENLDLEIREGGRQFLQHKSSEIFLDFIVCHFLTPLEFPRVRKSFKRAGEARSFAFNSTHE